MKNNLLKDAINQAGGITKVATQCELSYEAVRKWIKNGLPRTEWTGETEYVKVICRMQNTYSESELLERPAP